MEDIWYSIVNAVKQLDSKLSKLVDDLKIVVADVQDLKTKISAQEKTIANLVEQNKIQDK